MPDIAAALVEELSRFGLPVYMGLPKAFDAKKLPCLNVVEVGALPTVAGFNRGLVDTVDYDVELFCSPRFLRRGRADPLARQVRAHVFRGWSSTRVRCVYAGRPERRPDKNPNVVCLAFTVRLSATE